MNIAAVTPKPFANGFDHFCPDCGVFFSVQYEKDKIRDIETENCPSCGGDLLMKSPEEITGYCNTYEIDPVNFYKAFPPDEPIPQSCTGATPRQVEWIIGCVISDKLKKIPVTIESLSSQLGYEKNIVAAVFEELHITQDKEQSK